MESIEKRDHNFIDLITNDFLKIEKLTVPLQFEMNIADQDLKKQ